MTTYDTNERAYIVSLGCACMYEPLIDMSNGKHPTVPWMAGELYPITEANFEKRIRRHKCGDGGRK